AAGGSQNRTATPRGGGRRWASMHTGPGKTATPAVTFATAASRSASSKITIGVLPPNSRPNLLRRAAPAAEIARPTRVLPVKLLRGTSGVSTIRLLPSQQFRLLDCGHRNSLISRCRLRDAKDGVVDRATLSVHDGVVEVHEPGRTERSCAVHLDETRDNELRDRVALDHV